MRMIKKSTGNTCFNSKLRPRNRASLHSVLAGSLSALIATTSFGCSSGKKGNCGSSPTAILLRSGLEGTESGLVGGFIKLKNGRECTVVIDVITPGPFLVINAWTSSHCKAEVNQDNLSFDLKIFGNNGYYPAVAWATEERIDKSLYGILDKTGTKEAFQESFASKFYVNSGTLPDDQQAECVKGDFAQTFCATLGDTTVYDLVIDPGIDPQLFQILSDARAKRDEVRAKASQVSGTAKLASDFSQDIESYWRNKKFFAFAPMVELWMTCSSPELKKAFLADAETKNASWADFNERFKNGQTDWVDAPPSDLEKPDASNITFTPTNIDLSYKPEAEANSKFNTNKANANSVVNPAQTGWQENVWGVWSKLDVTAFIKSCDNAPEVLKKLKSAALYNKTIWADLNTAGLVSGDAPKAGVKLRAYTEYVISQESAIREKLIKNWPALAGEILGGTTYEDIVVHSNVAMQKPLKQQLEPAFNPSTIALTGNAPSKDVWQFSVFSMNTTLFAATKAEVLTSGVKFKRDTSAALTFKEGDSGSLFSYRGQFPLLTLNSVEGKGTSGAAAVLPKPVDPNVTPQQAASAASERRPVNDASVNSASDPVSQNPRMPGQPQQQQVETQQNQPGQNVKRDAVAIPNAAKSQSAKDDTTNAQIDNSPRDRSTAWSGTSASIPGAEPPESYRASDDSCY